MAPFSIRPRPPGRREPTRRELAGRGLLVLAAASVLLAVAALRGTGALGGDPAVSASVRDAGGSLRPGADVKIAGVIVGRVTGLSRGDDGGVRVAMRLGEGDLEQVPGNVVARILPATVFGTTFVDLVVHGDAEEEHLAAGAEIPADRTQATLELQQALDDIDRLVTALGPAELATAIGATAQALDGRGRQIGRIIDTAESYLAALNPQLPLVRSNLRKLADNLDVVDRIAPDLLQATEDGLVTLDTVVTQQAAITALIAGGTSLVEASGGFLGENQERIVRLVRNGAVLLDVLYDNRRAGISGSIAANIAVGRELPGAVREGFVPSEAILQLDAPPYYTPADRPRYGGAGGAGTADLDGAGITALVRAGGTR